MWLFQAIKYNWMWNYWFTLITMTSSNKKRLKVRVPADGDWSDYWETRAITQQSADNESKNMFLCYLMMFPGCENMSFTPFFGHF